MAKIFNRLCIHTITTKPWSIEEATEQYLAIGVKGMTVWRDALAGRQPIKVGERLLTAGIEVVSLCRGGFFPSESLSLRQKNIDENFKALEEAAALNAPHLVLVCGAEPNQSLEASREQILAGIETILPRAEALNVKLAIEPLHPMYADTRSAINTLGQANDLAEKIDSPMVGVAVDVYHLWWDPMLENEIRRCGNNGHLLAYHICDWKYPVEDILNDRGLMGEGCIDISKISQWIASTGFNGYHEVEIFSNRYWTMDQQQFLRKIIKAYQDLS